VRRGCSQAHEDGGDLLVGVVVGGTEGGLPGVGRASGIDAGVVLPEFEDEGTSPRSTWAGIEGVLVKAAVAVSASVGGGGSAMAVEVMEACGFVHEALEIGGCWWATRAAGTAWMASGHVTWRWLPPETWP
jgi:hypothetical protein